MVDIRRFTAGAEIWQRDADPQGRRVMIWKYLTKPDAQWLTAWTDAMLVQQHGTELAMSERFIKFGQEISDPNDRETFQRALESASAGDLTLLEIDYPELAKLFPVAAKRGRPRDDKVWEAARDVRLIGQIWKQDKTFLESKLRHTQHRTGTIEVTAEQIVADRSRVDIDAICNRLHKKA
jgi:hypothetical protein